MVSSHAGKDKWETLQKDRTIFMMNSKWNGMTYSLKTFTNLNGISFIHPQEADSYTGFQLSSECTRVSYLIDYIVNNHPNLRAAITSIRHNVDNMRKLRIIHVIHLQVELFIKHKERLNNAPQVSEVALQGKLQSWSGAENQWHTPDEYKKPSKEEKKELDEWQRTNERKFIVMKQKTANRYKTKSNIKKRI